MRVDGGCCRCQPTNGINSVLLCGWLWFASANHGCSAIRAPLCCGWLRQPQPPGNSVRSDSSAHVRTKPRQKTAACQETSAENSGGDSTYIELAGRNSASRNGLGLRLAAKSRCWLCCRDYTGHAVGYIAVYSEARSACWYSAAERRQLVAPGVSQGLKGNVSHLAPEGRHGIGVGHGVAPPGLGSIC